MLDAATVLEAIDDAYRRKSRGKPRAYIGASIIGHPCDAYLALSLRGFPDEHPDPQLFRIFRDGHRLEAEIVRDLKMAGLNVIEVDPMTGQQFEYRALGGHVSSHVDGQIEIGDDEIALIEIKSMNANNFSNFVSLGVRYSHTKYYEQMQFCMGLSNIDQCLFIAYCKDNSKYHAEFVAFDELWFAGQKARVGTVVRNEARRVAWDETDWRCRGCFKATGCWFGVPDVIPECRKCAHAVPDESGGWWCIRHSRDARLPCGDFELYAPLPRRS